MRSYNYFKPIIFLAAMYFTYNLAKSVSMLSGVAEDLAGDIGFFVMIIAAVILFRYQTRNRRRRPK